MTTHKIKLARRGQVTIPKNMRDEHKWNVGQQFSIFDLEGVVLMSPRASKVDALSNRLREDLLGEGETLDTILAELRQSKENGKLT